MNIHLQVMQLQQELKDTNAALVALRVKLDALIARQSSAAQSSNNQQARKAG